MVPGTGLEPARLTAYAPQAYVYTKFHHPGSALASYYISFVLERGLEPPRSKEHTVLNGACLPVSTLQPGHIIQQLL